MSTYMWSHIRMIEEAYSVYQIPSSTTIKQEAKKQTAGTLAKHGTDHAEAFVEFSKRIPGYTSNLCVDDQITLVKGASIEAMLLRASHFYQENKFALNRRLDSTDIRHAAKQKMKAFFQKVRNYELDTTQFSLLQSLVLMSPDREMLKNKSIVSKLRFQNAEALRLYSRYQRFGKEDLNESQWPRERVNKHTAVAMAKLIEILTDLRSLKVIYQELLFERRLEDLTPLLCEIWDLNPLKCIDRPKVSSKIERARQNF